jgi:hypothetical protein
MSNSSADVDEANGSARAAVATEESSSAASFAVVQEFKKSKRIILVSNM